MLHPHDGEHALYMASWTWMLSLRCSPSFSSDSEGDPVIYRRGIGMIVLCRAASAGRKSIGRVCASACIAQTAL